MIEFCGYWVLFVGCQFVYGVLDCYFFVVDWYDCECGIYLLDFEWYDNWWVSGGDFYLQYYVEVGFCVVLQDMLEWVGDVILMQF